MICELKFDGGTDIPRELDLAVDLDFGCRGMMQLNGHWPNVHRGVTASLNVAGRSFPVVVRGYSTPWRGDGQSIEFVDPLTASAGFDRESLCHGNEGVSFEKPVATRLACEVPADFHAAKWPQLIVDRLSLREVLTDICARQNWRMTWREGTCVLGPLADTPARQLTEVANEADVEGGFEADVYLDIPALGEHVAVVDDKNQRPGIVTKLKIDPRRPLVCRVTVQEAPLLPLKRVRPTGCLLQPGVVTQIGPLLVQVQFDEGEPQLARGQLYSPEMAAFQLKTPLRADDPVLVAWPTHALTTQPLPVFPLGPSSPGDCLRLIAERIEIDERLA